MASNLPELYYHLAQCEPLAMETPKPPDSNHPLYLSLIRQDQGGGLPQHWFLFISGEGEPGWKYEIKNDVGFMPYDPSLGPVDLADSTSPYTMLVITTLTDHDAIIVNQLAHLEVPFPIPDGPLFPTKSQFWVFRVLAKLIPHGIVAPARLEQVISMAEPLFHPSLGQLGWQNNVSNLMTEVADTMNRGM
ncbi:hypothetical protein BDW59DRAFT_163404 [Aspergillus cavernicola]|uniref:Uncharacterized protein n=1 Tax=Aspergillus cavernicola TaxID=176166 RepID=A0ABR4I669_9EURO